MTQLMRRLDRDQTQTLLEEERALSIVELADRLPERGVITTSSELGGLEIDEERLAALRVAIVALARAHGYPEAPTSIGTFEGHCARLLRSELDISPHEASEEGVWSHLTVCWLMDVAVWRWGGIGDERRFRGDVNRNTFRRLWWRAEVFGNHFDLTQLGEDEFVNIMERPTIAANRRLVRMLATAFLARLEAGAQADRMMLMREACKHIVRITPIIDLFALDDATLRLLLNAILDAASTASALVFPSSTGAVPAPEASDGVERVTALAAADIPDADVGSGGELPEDVAELANIAIGLAQRAGRVTNESLREIVPLDALAARRLLQGLVKRGELNRRGQARGTYYVVAQSSPDTPAQPGPPPDERPPSDTTTEEPAGTGAGAFAPSSADDADGRTPTGGPSRAHSPRQRDGAAPAGPAVRPARDALRRLLRRR